MFEPWSDPNEFQANQGAHRNAAKKHGEGCKYHRAPWHLVLVCTTHSIFFSKSESHWCGKADHTWVIGHDCRNRGVAACVQPSTSRILKTLGVLQAGSLFEYDSSILRVFTDDQNSHRPQLVSSSVQERVPSFEARTLIGLILHVADNFQLWFLVLGWCVVKIWNCVLYQYMDMVYAYAVSDAKTAFMRFVYL